jgi:hypothetical protein
MSDEQDIAEAKQAYQEYLAHLEQNNKVQPEQSLPQKVGSAVKTALKPLGYLGGLTRTGVAQAIEPLTGKEFVSQEDWDKAIAGEAPSSAEYMERAGVPEGISLGDIPGLGGIKNKWYDPSVRGTVGFVGDVALDPFTYLSGGLSAAAKAGTTESKLLNALKLANKDGLTSGGRVVNAALNPIETYNRNNADKLYTKAFQKLDKYSAKEDLPLTASQILKKEGYVGNMQGAVDKLKEISDKAGDNINNIYSEAANRGAKVDLMSTFDDALQYAQELKKLSAPEAHDLANQIETRVQGIWDKHGSSVGVDLAQQEKTFLNNLVKKSGFGAGDEAALGTIAKKSIGGGLASGEMDAVKNLDQELYNKLLENNKLYRSTSPDILPKFQDIASQVTNARSPFQVSLVDAMLAGAGGHGLMSGHLSELAPLAAKKTVQAAMSTEGRTARAALAGAIGEGSKGMTDSAARNIWQELMNKQEKKK